MKRYRVIMFCHLAEKTFYETYLKDNFLRGYNKLLLLNILFSINGINNIIQGTSKGKKFLTYQHKINKKIRCVSEVI